MDLLRNPVKLKHTLNECFSYSVVILRTKLKVFRRLNNLHVTSYVQHTSTMLIIGSYIAFDCNKALWLSANAITLDTTVHHLYL